MRDIFLVLCAPIFLFYAFRSPYSSLYLWLWTAMYPMQNWVYGIALSFRFNMLYACITIFGYFVILKNKPEFKNTLLFTLILIFFFHCFLSVAINNLDYQWDRLTYFFKSIILFIFCVLMLRDKNHFNAIIAFLSISLCYYGLMEGLKYISTGGAHKIGGMIGPLGDNNKSALGLNMCIPLLIYLISQAHNKYFKLFYIGVCVVCAVAVLGTNSRGGMLSLAFLATYYWWITGKKLYIPILFVLCGMVVINYMPDSWLQRMETIDNADVDESFLSRIFFWKINFLSALENPFFGVGFDATSSRPFWEPLTSQANSMNWISNSYYTPHKGYVAHSIYFQILGNQGFIGLILFLAILKTTFTNLNSVINFQHNEAWEKQLAKSIKVSMIAFCIGGAALNAIYFELLYVLFAMTICLYIKTKISIADKPS